MARRSIPSFGARNGRRQVLNLMDKMRSRPQLARSAGTRLDDLLHAGFSIVKRRSLVFVISDFISAPGWAKPLALLARRHEVIAVRLYDPLEMELPDIGLFVMQDAETGEQLFIDTHDRGFRKRFAELARQREAELRGAFRDAGVDRFELATDDSSATRSCASPSCASAAPSLRRAACPGTSRQPHDLLWPEFLWLLILVPLLVVAYLHILRRKRRPRCAMPA